MSMEMKSHFQKCFLPTSDQDEFISDSLPPTTEAVMISWDEIIKDPKCIEHFFYHSETEKYEQ